MGACGSWWPWASAFQVPSPLSVRSFDIRVEVDVFLVVVWWWIVVVGRMIWILMGDGLISMYSYIPSYSNDVYIYS